MYVICAIVISVFLLRLFFLKISIKNEKAIIKNGGKEYGVKNTKYITILHILMYVLSVTEAVIKNSKFDLISVIGVALLGFSMVMLYVVTRLLGEIWTVKLMILKDHKYVDHWLFRNIKHPNYFLNIVPELIGVALICHSLYTSIVILPLYAIVLYCRIKEEEKLLKDIIIPNGCVTRM